MSSQDAKLLQFSLNKIGFKFYSFRVKAEINFALKSIFLNLLNKFLEPCDLKQLVFIQLYGLDSKKNQNINFNISKDSTNELVRQFTLFTFHYLSNFNLSYSLFPFYRQIQNDLPSGECILSLKP